ncbi:hypothetical protein M407DRAFT_29243, partial [Tulasnella calospora MUT 4182]
MILEPFRDRHRLNPEPPPRSSINDHNSDEGNLDTKQDGEEVAANEINTKKLSARERLDKLSKFRTNPAEISVDPSGGSKGGGKAEVVQATFKRRIWSRKEKVAVKKLRYYQDMASHMFANSFVHEVETMAGLSHQNIVRFLAFVEDLRDGKAWIIMSWEPNGNVCEFLASGKWEVPERISLIQDTFEGLQYLHTRQPPICHGDLKSLNILVSSSYRAIITDFGSARAVRESTEEGRSEFEGSDRGVKSDPTLEKEFHQINVVATRNQLTLTGPAWSLRWAPPEVVNGNRPGLCSDIWSAGWVCWEIMTGKFPFSDLQSEPAIMMQVIEGQVPSALEEQHLSQIVRLCSLMTDCWAFDPQERPNVSRCRNEVRWMPSIAPLGGVPSDSKVVTNRLLLQMGHMHYLQARYQDAASVFQQVLNNEKSKEDRNEKGEALYWLGKVSAAQCQYLMAEWFFTQAKDTSAGIRDDRGRANALQGLGDICHLHSKFSEAEESFSQAQSIYDALGDDQGLAGTLCGLGRIYLVQSKYELAEDTFRRGHEIYGRIGDGQGRANTLHGLGSVYHLQSRLAKAERAFNGAQNIYARIGDDRGQAQALLGLGGIRCDR